MPSIIVALIGINGLNDRAADLTRANIIAEKKFEQLRNEGYNSLVDGSYDFSSELNNSFKSPKDADYVVTTPETGIKNVALNIEYTSNGSLKSLDFEMLISELGVAQ